MTTLIATLPLQVLCQLIGSQSPNFDSTNVVQNEVSLRANMTTLTASLPLQVLCQLIGSRSPNFNLTNVDFSNFPAVVNQPQPPVKPATLPDGYVAFPDFGVAYKYNNESRLTWAEAKEKCILEGGNLAILDTREKLDQINNKTGPISENFWIGLYRTNGVWVGIDYGLTPSNVPWYPSYPDAVSKHHCAYVCVAYTNFIYVTNDYDCYTALRYMCEIPIPKNYKPQENQFGQILVD